MANYDNIRDHGFDKRSAAEVREIQARGGRNSGKARRKRADFRKTLNLLLTTKIDNKEWTPILEALGIDSTLESALNMKMILEALGGDVKAAHYVAQYAGQDARQESDTREQKARTDKLNAETVKVKESGNSSDEALAKLDKILEGVNRVMDDD